MSAFYVALYLTIFSFIGCRVSGHDGQSSQLLAAESFEPVAARSGRFPICGIESYKSRPDPVCGVQSYKSSRSAVCGVESYNERADLGCPGSIPEDVKEIVTSGSKTNSAERPAACPAGYAQIGENQHKKKDYLSCRRGDCPFNEVEYVATWTRTCRREAYAASCRRPEFGVERYAECRHENHGVEAYKTCARSEFGVAAYKSCSYYMNADEMRRFLAERVPMVNFMAETLLSSRGNFYAEESDEVGLACTIKMFANDPLYQDIVQQLKTIFTTRFGLDVDARDDNCDEVVPEFAIEAMTCEPSDNSRRCRAWRSYTASKRWLTVTREDAANLAADIAARADTALRDELLKLKSSIETVENKHAGN